MNQSQQATSLTKSLCWKDVQSAFEKNNDKPEDEVIEELLQNYNNVLVSKNKELYQF